jgi:hypothetical protein
VGDILAEAEPGIDQDFVARDAGTRRSFDPILKPLIDFD